MTRSRRYPLLFSPISVGPLRLENRIVFAAHLTNYAEDGLPPAQHAAYYEARAAGGAGGGARDHRGALGSPHGLAAREGHLWLQPGSDPGLPQDHRQRAPPRHADLRPAQP